MNERIKKFAEEAGVIFVPASTDYFGEFYPSAKLTDKMDLEKFAELIVKECVLEAMDAIHHNTSIRTQLYEHFGVE